MVNVYDFVDENVGEFGYFVLVFRNVFGGVGYDEFVLLVLSLMYDFD